MSQRASQLGPRSAALIALAGGRPPPADLAERVRIEKSRLAFFMDPRTPPDDYTGVVRVRGGLGDALPEVLDSLVVDLEYLGRESWMPLFVVLGEGTVLDATLVARLKDTIRRALSPRHVPDEVYAIAEVPRTLSGKVLEVPVKRILTGTPPEQAASRDSLANPAALDWFVELSSKLGSHA